MRHHPELGGQHHLVAATFERLPDQFFIGVRPVDLGGVDESDPQVERAVNRADRFGVVGARPGVSEGHAHGAQADPRDVEVTQLHMLHGCLLLAV